MKRRALIIGSQTPNLQGVHNDVAAIISRLEVRGFEVAKHIEGDATRDGILAGLERLITDSHSGDAALIYYSGHGARVINPEPAEGQRREPKLLHCLVPTDWYDSGFRGLLDIELSAALARLTEATPNVGLILDCCFSARMWRGPVQGEVVARALDRIYVDGVDEHLAQLRTLDRVRLRGESNPNAVRLVACEADRAAYELPLDFDNERRRMGIMTAMLATILDEIGDSAISWRTLGMLVRERVMQHNGDQRPEVEGPGQRYLFELAAAKRGGAVVYFRDEGGRHALRACRLLGAEPGARYSLMAKGRSEHDEAESLAEAEVTSIVGTRAYIELTPRDAAVDVGALAFPVSTPLGKHAVRLIGGVGKPSEALHERIGLSKYVRVAEPDDGAIMELTVGEQLGLCIDGAPVAHTEPNDEAGRERTLVRLERWARAETLRNLAGYGERSRFEIEWGRVVDGQRVPMHVAETFYIADLLYVALKNTSDRSLFFSVFDIGVDGAINLLTRAEPTGTQIEPGDSYELGLDGDDMACSWPEAEVPGTRPLPESLVVIVAASRHDMTAFETDCRARSGRAPASELECVLDQLGGGGTRNFVAAGKQESGAYAVARIDFQTSPQRRVAVVLE